MHRQPSYVQEITRKYISAYRGLMDVSKWGGGGVWFRGTNKIILFVWFYKWPESVKNNLCTVQNVIGNINIYDLELLGILIYWLTLEDTVGSENLKHESPTIQCDDISTVSWVQKFRSNSSPVVGNILRSLATQLLHVN